MNLPEPINKPGAGASSKIHGTTEVPMNVVEELIPDTGLMELLQAMTQEREFVFIPMHFNSLTEVMQP